MGKDEFTVSVIQNTQEFQTAMELRRQEFVIKQGIPEDREFDGNDFSATHFVLKKEDAVVGYLRARYFGDMVKLERMLLKDGFKGKDLAQKILDYSFQLLSKKGFNKVVCIASTALFPHWEKKGFKEITEQDRVFIGDKEFVPIEYDISGLAKNPLNIKSNFDVLSSNESKIDEAEARIAKQNQNIIMSSLSNRSK